MATLRPVGAKILVAPLPVATDDTGRPIALDREGLAVVSVLNQQPLLTAPSSRPDALKTHLGVYLGAGDACALKAELDELRAARPDGVLLLLFRRDLSDDVSWDGSEYHLIRTDGPHGDTTFGVVEPDGEPYLLLEGASARAVRAWLAGDSTAETHFDESVNSDDLPVHVMRAHVARLAAGDPKPAGSRGVLCDPDGMPRVAGTGGWADTGS